MRMCLSYILRQRGLKDKASSRGVVAGQAWCVGLKEMPLAFGIGCARRRRTRAAALWRASSSCSSLLTLFNDNFVHLRFHLFDGSVQEFPPQRTISKFFANAAASFFAAAPGVTSRSSASASFNLYRVLSSIDQ